MKDIARIAFRPCLSVLGQLHSIDTEFPDHSAQSAQSSYLDEIRRKNERIMKIIKKKSTLSSIISQLLPDFSVDLFRGNVEAVKKDISAVHQLSALKSVPLMLIILFELLSGNYY